MKIIIHIEKCANEIFKNQGLGASKNEKRLKNIFGCVYYKRPTIAKIMATAHNIQIGFKMFINVTLLFVSGLLFVELNSLFIKHIKEHWK